MHFKQKVLKFVLTHTTLVLVTVGLGHGVYRKLYTLIGVQHAEMFENHWPKVLKCAGKPLQLVHDPVWIRIHNLQNRIGSGLKKIRVRAPLVTRVDQAWMELMVFKIFAEQDWIGFNPDQDWSGTEKFHSPLISAD